MRRPSLVLLVCSTLGAAAAAPVAGQSLAQQIARAGDASVRFSYPTAANVCGDGESIVRFDADDDDGYSVMRHRGATTGYRDMTAEQVRARCRFGPASVVVTLADGRAQRVTVRVGEPAPGTARDLGLVSAAAAIEYLVGTAGRQVGGEALFAATIADGDWAPAMLSLASDRDVVSEVRREAIFWTSQAAGEKATRGLRSILGDDSEEIDVRKHALFAISQRREDEAVSTLIDVARTSAEPELRRTAFFWLGQRSDDPRVMQLFRSVILETP